MADPSRPQRLFRLPPLMGGAGLLFWGAWSGMLPAALVLALLVELQPRIPWRWDFDDRDFDRVVDLTSIGMVLAAIYLISRFGASDGVVNLINWMPLILFPLVAAQHYCQRGRINLSSLFLSLRSQRKRRPDIPIPDLDLSYPFFASTLLAAAVVTDATNPWFFPSALPLVGWALWSIRAAGYPPALWVALLLAGAGLGYAGQFGLRALQMEIEDVVVGWLRGDIDIRLDPSRLATGIGHIGTLKLSNRIEWQVQETRNPPLRLRRAIYQHYRGGVWQNRGQELQEVLSQEGEPDWRIAPSPPAGLPTEKLLLSGEVPLGTTLLPLPPGAFHISRLPAEKVRRHPLGALLVEGTPEFIALPIEYRGGTETMPPPTSETVDLSPVLLPALEQIVAELGLREVTPAQAAERLRDYFDRNFAYTLETIRDRVPNTIAHFLLNSRRGHCEYFASATVLLLQTAGIPARYVSGFVVEEFDPMSGSYLIRRRHAHAWALAWIDGQWRDLDFTPAVWREEEEATAPWWGKASDLWRLLAFAVQRGTATAEERSDLWLFAIALPLMATLAWRLRRGMKRQAGDAGRREGAGPLSAASDPDFQRILARLERLDDPPLPGETLRRWIDRLYRAHLELPPQAPLEEALELHYQLRFGPRGINDKERERLRERAQEWLKEKC